MEKGEIGLQSKLEGKVIVFEGIDGCGKDTQLELFYQRLRKEFPKLTILLTREPWDDPRSPDSMRIRRILKQTESEIDPGDGVIIPEKLQTMYVADRYIHWVKVILPGLEKKALVISNRERYSTMAYGIAFDLDIKEIQNWHKLLPEPDLIIYFKISTETALKRLNKRAENLEYFEKKKTLVKINQAYNFILENNLLNNIIPIDGEKKIEDVQVELWKKVLRKLKIMYP